MQGQKGSIGSLPESLAMDHGSVSSDSSLVDQPVFWTNFMRTTPANNPSGLDLNSPNHESQTVNIWTTGEPSSTTLPIQTSQNRADPLENRHLPCKRKAPEISISQSSSGIESSSIFQIPESSTSVWQPFSENPSSSNSINPRLGLSVGSFSSDNSSSENSRRNVRIRINNSRQQDSLPATNNNPGHLNFPTSYPSLGPNPGNSSVRETQPVLRAPRRNLQISSRSRSSSSRATRPVSLNNGTRTLPTNISDHPLFFQLPAINLNSNPMPNVGPHRGVGGEQTGNLFSRIVPPGGSSASFSQEAGIPPVIGLPGGRERRGRLVSEIRNVLDLIRRGEGLRFEDVMLLDQSMFYGMADIHDRHRDMRLDIDNMSYEELLALEERIGNVNTGLTEENISSCVKTKTYVTITGQLDAEPCCICQDEYKNGDALGELKCGHDFHTNCIKKWLLQKNLCPVCKSAATKTAAEARKDGFC